MNTPTPVAMTPLTEKELAEARQICGECLDIDRKVNAEPDRATIQRTDVRVTYEYLARLLATIAHERADRDAWKWKCADADGRAEKAESALAVVTEACVEYGVAVDGKADPQVVCRICRAYTADDPAKLPHANHCPLKSPQAAATALLARLEKAEGEVARLGKSHDDWKAAWYALSHDSGVKIDALTVHVARLEKTQLPAGTIAVCQRYVFHDCVNHRGHLQWKYGATVCNYGTCPRREAK